MAFGLSGAYFITQSRAASPPNYDLNNDNIINIFDLSILLSQWGATGANTADFNSDNVVNIFDLSTLLSHWGQSTYQTFSPTAYTNGAINTAISLAQSAGGGVVQLGEGTYTFTGSVILDASNLIIQGAGPGKTIIKMSGSLDEAFRSATTARNNITIKDMTVDMSGATGSYAQAFDVKNPSTNTTIRNIDFTGISNNQRVVFLSGADLNARIENSRFWGGDIRYGNAIYIAEPTTYVTITNNRFHYLYRGIYTTGSGTNQITHLNITNNTFDGGWYTNPPLVSGTASFTLPTGPVLTAANSAGLSGDQRNIVLNDPSANFLDPSYKLAAHFTIRLLVPRVTRTEINLQNSTKIMITNTNARVGDWIRTSSGKFAVVNKVNSDSVEVEEWLDNTTRMPAAAPGSSDSWTLYKTVIGQVWGGTATGSNYVEGTEPADPTMWETGTATSAQIHADPRVGWRDMDGVNYAPSGSVQYELTPRGEYQLFISRSVSDVTIENNVFKRSWADSIGSGTSSSVIANAVVRGNTIYGGQDMGITFEGFVNGIVENNTISDTGTHGVAAVNSSGITIQNNTINRGGWQNISGTGIDIRNSENITVATILYNPDTSIRAFAAIRIRPTTTGTKITGGIQSNGSSYGLSQEGSPISGTTGDFRGITVRSTGGATPPLGSFSGTAVPTTSSIVAAVGSTYEQMDGSTVIKIYDLTASGWLAR